MSSGDHLYRLIHSLTKAEKRHFRNQFLPGQQDNSYTRLFDSINRSGARNDGEVPKRAKGGNFASTKHLLYKRLLKSLAQLHSEKTPNAQALNRIARAELLYQKCLYKEGLACIREAYQVAMKLRNHALLPEIMFWERLFLRHLRQEVVPESAVRQGDLLKALAEAQYLILLDESIAICRNRRRLPRVDLEEQVARLLEHPAMQAEVEFPSFLSQHYWYEVHLNLALASETWKQCQAGHRDLMALWEKHPGHQSFLSDLYGLKKLEWIRFELMTDVSFDPSEAVQALKQAVEDNPHKTAEMDLKCRVLEWAWKIGTKDLPREAALPWSELEQEAVFPAWPLEWQFWVLFLQVEHAIQQQQYRKALQLLREWEQMSVPGGREIYWVQVLQLLAYFELGQDSLFDSVALSMARKIRPRQKDLRLEKMVLQHLNQKSKLTRREESAALSQEFLRTYRKLVHLIPASTLVLARTFETWIQLKTRPGHELPKHLLF